MVPESPGDGGGGRVFDRYRGVGSDFPTGTGAGDTGRLRTLEERGVVDEGETTLVCGSV